jgi:hypothetical protein
MSSGKGSRTRCWPSTPDASQTAQHIAAATTAKRFGFDEYLNVGISVPMIWECYFRSYYVLSRPDLEMVALDYFRRLGHDNHRRLSKLYAWEGKKSKTSWGGESVDYEKIAAAAVQAMKAADLNRFLVVCALVSDLYCPGYNPRQSLEKNSNLARAAVRYKVDSARIAAAARAELSQKKCTQGSNRKSVTNSEEQQLPATQKKTK